ncbi:MAG: tetratricopeptide repeat protein [Pseudomonadales bacterium]|nr:tetratricopeptide repeat protein [Pseudomonadales bacterium]
MIARTSSFQFKGKTQDIREIGALLNASHILEGSVRKMGTRIRVTAQLNNTENGTRVWSDQYDRELTDVFEVQDEITQNICQALNAELSGSHDFVQPTKNVEAHNAYLLGRFHNGRDEYEQAIRHLEKAAALDPNYADSYSALAIVHSNQAGLGFAPYREKLPLIRAFSDKALAINPVHTLARDVKAQIRFYVDHDFQGAIDASTKLIEEDPRLLNNYGNQLSNLGQFDMAMQVLDQALKLDPLSPLVLESRGLTLLSAGRFSEAHAAFQMRESLGVASTEHFALLARMQSDISGIRKQLDRDREDWRMNHSYTLFEAAIPYLEGDHEKVISKLRPLKQATGFQSYSTKLQSACLEQDVDLAVSYFEQGIEELDRMMLGLVCRTKEDPLYSELRSQPKFQRIVRQLGLDDASIARLRFPPLPF